MSVISLKIKQISIKQRNSKDFRILAVLVRMTGLARLQAERGAL